MNEIVQVYRAHGSAVFNAKYGPSGKLRQGIEVGAVVDVFASAAVEHTESLAKQGLLGASQIFMHKIWNRIMKTSWANIWATSTARQADSLQSGAIKS